ncbi:MAG: exodeoxyribonuclease III [Bacteroidia bacterium]|nr:exodeoxyribonuclease III [Bacteroidia bacterium]
MSIVSYNINGIRAAVNRGLFDWVGKKNPDIICFQELKAWPDQVGDDILKPLGYNSWWHHATSKKGYSGVAIYSKIEPKHVEIGCGMEKYDQEGRVIRADFNDFSVISLYLPSGTTGDVRQDFKEEFMDDFYHYIQDLKKSIPNLIICGDYNICHKEIDIHNPSGNKNNSGFLPHEREWVTKFLEGGFTDSFRKFNQGPDQYTWWTFRAGARGNNKGWRIDYQMVSNEMADRCVDARIHADAVHSDHCPIELIIK